MKNPRPRCHPSGGLSVSSDSNSNRNAIVSATVSTPQALPIIIAKFWRDRHRKESVVLQLRSYQDAPLVDLRLFETGSDGIDRPTTKGLALSIKRLPALADAFASANREAHRLGLFGTTGRSS